MALSHDEMAALDLLIDRRVRAALADVDRALVVQAVNADGTVNLAAGESIIPSVPALRSYAGREAGHTVLTRVRGGEHIVLGRVGPPDSAPLTMEISNTAPPTGQGWVEIVTGAVWAKTGALWCKRVIADPGPSGGSTSRVGTLRTYRGGAMTQMGVAEQGDWTGRGLQTGLAHLAGSWVTALASKTITGGVIDLHRQDAGGIYGAVPVQIYRCLAGAAVPEATPTLIPGALSIGLGRNQTGRLTVDAAWLAPFKDGTADSLAIWTATAAENAQLDSLALTITTA